MSYPGTKLDPIHGYHVLDPMPERKELEQFYQDDYYDLIGRGERAADIARTRQGGAASENQDLWFRETVHKEMHDLVFQNAPGDRVIEVGCGMGNLLADLQEAGLRPTGVDLAPESVSAVRARGLEALLGAFDMLVEGGEIEPGQTDAVIFNNVLELTHDPIKNLRAAAEILKPGGLIIVRAGNDFNALQETAVEKLGLPRWWVSPPGHINYLNFDAVESMLRAVGALPFHRHGEFPMELWLLLGFDYINNPELGADCHNRRMAFERSLPPEVRGKLNMAFGHAGLGRTMVIAGRLA